MENLENNNKIPNNMEINPQISEIINLERVDNREILAFNDRFVVNIRIMKIKCVGPENWCVEHPLPNQSPVIKLINEHIEKKVSESFLSENQKEKLAKHKTNHKGKNTQIQI
ncbi:MAG: hypothetical protein GY938_10860 [Ketobacter sp.]|nr:hypothetical protein [Ketobacter sp.]